MESKFIKSTFKGVLSIYDERSIIRPSLELPNIIGWRREEDVHIETETKLMEAYADIMNYAMYRLNLVGDDTDRKKWWRNHGGPEEEYRNWR